MTPLKLQSNGPIIQQYGDWYTGRWWMGYDIRYSEDGPGRGHGQCTNFILFDVAL